MKRAYELEMYLKTVAIKEACFKRFESSSPPLNESSQQRRFIELIKIHTQYKTKSHTQDLNYALYFNFEQIPHLHNRGKCQIIHIEKVNRGPKYQGHVYLSFFQDSINKRIL